MAKELKNILVNALHDAQLRKFASKYAMGRLLDIGCGSKQYLPIFKEFVSDHVGLDHEQSPHGLCAVDLIGNAYNIPEAENSFDCVLCTSVLEHIEEPLRALIECKRVLRPGGYAIYSVPFIWHLHEEPRDFFRYTSHGLLHLFHRAGFDVVELVPIMGFWGTHFQMLSYGIQRYNRGPLRWFRIVDLFSLLAQALGYLADKVDYGDAWPSLYMIVAKKT